MRAHLPLLRRSGPDARKRPTARGQKCALALGASLALALAVFVGCGAGVPQTLPETSNSENSRETYARRALQDARALRDEARLEAAARVAARGLELSPDDPELHRVRAEVLEALGLPEQASAHRRMLELIAPPPSPLPLAPLDLPSQGVLLSLISHDEPDEKNGANRVPPDWPHGEVAELVTERLRTRLPDARIEQGAEHTSVSGTRAALAAGDIRAVISLRIDRAFCGDTVKDGAFAVSWLRLSAAAADGGAIGPLELRYTVQAPRTNVDCRREAVARVVESALTRPEVQNLLGGTSSAAPRANWSTASLRSLYPEIGRHLDAEISSGRERLASGELSRAVAHFREATRIDPEDIDARALLDDTELTLSLARELGNVSSRAESTETASGSLSFEFTPDFSPVQRRRLEQRLVEERRLRGELLATLAVLDEDRRPPGAGTLSALRPAEIWDMEAVGPRLARTRAPAAAIEARVLYAPDGSVLARYYFAVGSEVPLLREEDTAGDGAADRWIAYEAGARHEVWEDRMGKGAPDLHLIFAAGGDPLERLEVDGSGDGRADRIFHYVDGQLSAEDSDTTGNGLLDRFERFDASGSLMLRGEDLNNDGQVDVYTTYDAGRIVRREILNPDVVTAVQ